MPADRSRRRLLVAILTLTAGGIAAPACLPAERLVRRIRGPAPTATPFWVGKVDVDGESVDTRVGRVAEVDERTGRPLARPFELRQGPGVLAERNGVLVQPGETVLVTAIESLEGQRFFQVRSFDGLRRGWLSEQALAPQSRPAAPTAAP